jgi:hypothetical protein
MLRDNIFSNITGNYISRPIGIRRIYFFWPLLSHYKIHSDIGTMQRESNSSYINKKKKKKKKKKKTKLLKLVGNMTIRSPRYDEKKLFLFLFMILLPNQSNVSDFQNYLIDERSSWRNQKPKRQNQVQIELQTIAGNKFKFTQMQPH